MAKQSHHHFSRPTGIAIPEYPNYVPTDFSNDRLKLTLTSAGFAGAQKSLFT
jgi:hypothetical protein